MKDIPDPSCHDGWHDRMSCAKSWMAERPVEDLETLLDAAAESAISPLQALALLPVWTWEKILFVSDERESERLAALAAEHEGQHGLDLLRARLCAPPSASDADRDSGRMAEGAAPPAADPSGNLLLLAMIEGLMQLCAYPPDLDEGDAALSRLARCHALPDTDIPGIGEFRTAPAESIRRLASIRKILPATCR